MKNKTNKVGNGMVYYENILCKFGLSKDENVLIEEFNNAVVKVRDNENKEDNLMICLNFLTKQVAKGARKSLIRKKTIGYNGLSFDDDIQDRVLWFCRLIENKRIEISGLLSYISMVSNFSKNLNGREMINYIAEEYNPDDHQNACNDNNLRMEQILCRFHGLERKVIQLLSENYNIRDISSKLNIKMVDINKIINIVRPAVAEIMREVV